MAHKFPEQVNYAFPKTFDMSVAAPAIANRIFDTKADAVEFINDLFTSAVPGIILRVINDSEDNLGAYLVKITEVDEEHPMGMMLEKIGGSNIDLDWNDLKA